MSYIDNQFQKIHEFLIQNGCSMYETDLEYIKSILAECIIASHLDSSLVEDAVNLIHGQTHNGDL